MTDITRQNFCVVLIFRTFLRYYVSTDEGRCVVIIIPAGYRTCTLSCFVPLDLSSKDLQYVATARPQQTNFSFLPCFSLLHTCTPQTKQHTFQHNTVVLRNTAACFGSHSSGYNSCSCCFCSRRSSSFLILFLLLHPLLQFPLQVHS